MDELIYNPFGLLILDKLYEVYRTKYIFHKTEIDVTIDVDMVKEIEFLIDFLKDYDKWFKNITQKSLFEDLLKKKNDYWIELGDNKITKEELINKISLKRIEFMLFPYITLIYNDNNVFYDHDIVIELNCRDYENISLNVK